ncbi:hypothetical protein ACWEJ6_49100 [Nonomuraea sp. NPDC004702]
MTSVLDFGEEHKAQAQAVIKPLKVMAIMSGVEAAARLQWRWAQGRNVAGARAVYDIRRYMGGLPGNRKLSELISERLKAGKFKNSTSSHGNGSRRCRPR